MRTGGEFLRMFVVTQDPCIVSTSNMCAILGLAVVLVFGGAKMLLTGPQSPPAAVGHGRQCPGAHRLRTGREPG